MYPTANLQPPTTNRRPPVPAPSGSSDLYSPYFTKQERRDLEEIPPGDLTGEIHLQRALLILLLERFPANNSDFDLLLSQSRAANQAIRSLITLIYAESERLSSRETELQRMLAHSLHIARLQMGVYDYLAKPGEPLPSASLDPNIVPENTLPKRVRKPR